MRRPPRARCAYLYSQITIPKAVAREIAAGRALGIPLPELTAYQWIQVRQVMPLARRWAAAWLVEKTGNGNSTEAARPVERDDRILREVRAEGFAHLSRYSPAGFNLRLERFGQSLTAVLQESAPAATEELLAFAGEASAHYEAGRAPERVTRVGMAVRLLNWLATPQARSNSFAEAAHRYTNEDGFVDRARYCLDGSESIPQPVLRQGGTGIEQG